MTSTPLTLADVIATFEARKAAINARVVTSVCYALQWDNGLFVGVNDEGKGFAAGFEHAKLFTDADSAQRFRDQTNIRNGRNEHPWVVGAEDGKRDALMALDNVIANVSAQMEG